MPRTTNNSSIKQVWENNPDTPLIASTLSKSLNYSVSYKNFNTEYSPNIEGRDRILTLDPNDSKQILLKRSTIFQIINEATDDFGTPLIPANEQYKLFDVGLDDIILTINDTDETQSSKSNWSDGHWFVYICDKRDSSFYGKNTADDYGGGAQIIISKQNTSPSNVQVPGFPEYFYTEKDTRIIGGFQTNGGNIIQNSIWDIAGKFDTVKVRNGYYILDENVNPMAYSLRKIDFRDLNTNRNNIVEGSLTVQGVSNLNNNANITGNVSISSNNFKITSDNGQLQISDDGDDSLFETTISSTFNANTTFNNPITISTNVGQTGNYEITGDFTQTGDMNITGDTTLVGDLNQSGKVVIGESGNTITSAGSWSHNGSFQFDGELTVNEKATFNGDFFIKSNTIKFEDEQEDISFEIDALNNKFIYNSKLEVYGDILFQDGSVAINSDDNFYTSVPSDKVLRHSGGQFIIDSADFIVRKDIEDQLLNIDSSESLLKVTSNITSIIDDDQIIEILNSKEDNNNIITIQGNPNSIRIDGNLQLRNGRVDANITGDVMGNADTATQFKNAPTLKLVTEDSALTDPKVFEQDIIGNQEILELNIDHTHDGRYYTETETSDRFLRTHKDDDETAPEDQTALGNITFSGVITVQNSIVGNANTATQFENTLTLDVNSTDASDTDASLRMTDVFQNLVEINGNEETIDFNIDHTHDDRYYNKYDLNPNKTGDGVATLHDNVDFDVEASLDIRYYTQQQIDDNLWTREQLSSSGTGEVSWNVISGIPYDNSDKGAFKNSIPRLDHSHRLNISGLNNLGEEFPLRDFIAGWDVSSSLMNINFTGLSSIFSLEGEADNSTGELLSNERIVSEVLAGGYFILYFYNNSNNRHEAVRFGFNSEDNPSEMPEGTIPDELTSQETNITFGYNSIDQLEGSYFDVYDQMIPHRFWFNVEGAPDGADTKVDISSESSVSGIINSVRSVVDSLDGFNTGDYDNTSLEIINDDFQQYSEISFTSPESGSSIIGDIKTIPGTNQPLESEYRIVFSGSVSDYMEEYIVIYDGPNPVEIEFINSDGGSSLRSGAIEVEVTEGDLDGLNQSFVDAVNNSDLEFGFIATEETGEVLLTSKHTGLSLQPDLLNLSSQIQIDQTEEGTGDPSITTVDFSDSNPASYHDSHVVIYENNDTSDNFTVFRFNDTENTDSLTTYPEFETQGNNGESFTIDFTSTETLEDIITSFTSELDGRFTYERTDNVIEIKNKKGGFSAEETTTQNFAGTLSFQQGTDGQRHQSSTVTFLDNLNNRNRDYESSTISLYGGYNFTLYFHLTDGSDLAPDKPIDGYIYEVIIDPDYSQDDVVSKSSDSINLVQGFNATAVGSTLNIVHPLGETKDLGTRRGAEASEDFISISVQENGSSIVDTSLIEIYNADSGGGEEVGYVDIDTVFDLTIQAINDYTFGYAGDYPFEAEKDSSFKNITIEYGNYLNNQKDYSPSGSLKDRFVQTRFQNVEFSINKDNEVDPDDNHNYVLTRDEHLNQFHKYSIADKQKMLLSSTSSNFTNIITDASLDSSNAISYYQKILDDTYADSTTKVFDKQVINVDNIFIPDDGKDYIDVTIGTSGGEVTSYSVNDTSLMDYLSNTYLTVDGSAGTIGQDFYKKDVLNPNSSNDGEASTGDVGYDIDSPLDLRYHNKLDLNPTTAGSIYDGSTGTPDVGSGALDSRYYVKKELDDGSLDGRYYTETETDTKFLTKNGSDSQTVSGNITFSDTATFTNKILGNIDTADALKTARDISIEIDDGLGGAQTKTQSFDGSGNISFDITHNHNDIYYTQGQLNGGELNNLYYTESEIDGFLNNKDNYQSWSFSYGSGGNITNIESGDNIRFTGTRVTITSGTDPDVDGGRQINFKIDDDIINGISTQLGTSGIITISKLGKADETFDLDDRYYTETEVDNKTYGGWSITDGATTTNLDDRQLTNNGLTIIESGATSVSLSGNTLTISSDNKYVTDFELVGGELSVGYNDNSGGGTGLDFDTRYYTEGEIDGFFTEISTTGSDKTVHWDNITNSPDYALLANVYTQQDLNPNTTGDGIATTESDVGAVGDGVLDVRYYTETEVDDKLDSKSDDGHHHDDDYYKKQQADDKFQARENGFVYARVFTSDPDIPQNGDILLDTSNGTAQMYIGDIWVNIT